MKILVAFASFISLSFNCLAQCNNVTSTTDRFTDITTKQTAKPLVLKNDKYEVYINLEWKNISYEIKGIVRDKSVQGLPNVGNVSISSGNKIYFIFSNSEKSIFDNHAGTVDDSRFVENTYGTIDIQFWCPDRENSKEIEQKVINKFLMNDVQSIRIAGIKGKMGLEINLDFDLSNEQISFFKEAFQ